MILLDSSCWLEFFSHTEQGAQYEAAVGEPQSVLVPTVVLCEVARRVLQQRGEDAAMRVLAAMNECCVVDLTSMIAVEAAHLGVRAGLPLGDSIILATAQAFGATLWTQDSHFAALPGVKYFPKS